jgi:AcrR family transcriptional regulator
MEPSPRWRRRKAARPDEIEAAALEVFSARGFAAAKLEEIARLAGVSKAALYVYYPTKLDLFRAVVRNRALPNLETVAAVAVAEAPFPLLSARILQAMAGVLSQPGVRGLARMVIAESRNFPEMAVLWRETVVERGLGLLAAAVERAQARGEVRPGDPRLLAMSLVAPMMLGALWKEVMEPAGGAPLDLAALASEHAQTIAAGLAPTRSAAP